MPLDAHLELRPGSELPSFYYRDTASNFAIKVACCGAYSVAEHDHDNIQIAIPLQKTVAEVRWVRRDGRVMTAAARSGQVMIVPPHQRHAVSWRRQASFVNVHFGPLAGDDTAVLFDSVAAAGEMHVLRDPFISALGKSVAALVAGGADINPGIMMGWRLLLVEHVVSNYGPREDKRADERTSRLRRSRVNCNATVGPVMLGVTQSELLLTRAPDMAVNGLAPWQLRKVVATVEADLREDHSVAALANLVNLSKSHFSRAFRISTGLSPRQWIIQARVRLALSKLADSEESLAQVAQNCGFAEQSHFTRTFTQVTGVSPGAWRRANRF